MSDTGLIITGTLTVIFSACMLYLFYSLRLITEVRPDGLYIRYYPMRNKVISYANLRSCQARSYKPVREYGGWGIKYGPSGWAYNVSGDRGVQLVLQDGKRILIGTQRAQEFEEAIRSHWVSRGSTQ